LSKAGGSDVPSGVEAYDMLGYGLALEGLGVVDAKVSQEG
jgi:hypothetical protein